MLSMQESDLRSEWPVNVQVLLVLLLASCTQLITLQNLQKECHCGTALFWGFTVYAELKRVGMAGVEGEWFIAGWLTAMTTHFPCEPLLQHELHLSYKVQPVKNDCKLGLHWEGSVSDPQSNPQFIFQALIWLYNSPNLSFLPLCFYFGRCLHQSWESLSRKS